MKKIIQNYKAAKALFVLPLMLVLTIGAFIFLMSSGVSADGSTINVPSDYSTIQDAIDDNGTVNGDIISLDSNYSHNGARVVVDKSLTIEGNDQTINGGIDIEGGVDVVINNLNIDSIDPDDINSFSSLSSSDSEWVVVGVKSGKLTATNFDIVQERNDDEEKINLVGISVQAGAELVLEDSSFDLSNINNGIVYGVYAQGGSDKVALNNNEFDLFSDRRIAFVATGSFTEEEKPTIDNINNTLNPSGEGPHFMLQLGYWGSDMSRESLNLYADSILNDGETSYNYNQGWYEYIPGECDAKISSNIQNTINLATEGDTICVEAGTYEEQLIIEKDLSLIGIDNPIIQIPEDPEEDIEVDGSTKKWAPIVLVKGVDSDNLVDVNISGFEIDGNDHKPNNRATGVLLSYATGNINNLNINNFNLEKETFGISAYDSSDIIIDNNNIIEFGRGGISANGIGTKAVITNNEIVAGENAAWAANGIQIAYGATGLVEGNIIGDSEWQGGDDWAATAILLYDAIGDIEVNDNKVYGSDVGLYANGDLNLSFIDNEIHNSDYGFYAIDNVEIIVNNNEIYSNYYGFYLDENVNVIENSDENYFENNNVHVLNNSDQIDLDVFFNNNSYKPESRVVGNKILPVAILESAVLNGASDVFGSEAEDVLTFTFSDDIKMGEDSQKVYFKDASKLGVNSQDWSIEGNILRVKANRELNNPRPELGDFVMSFDKLLGLDFEHNVFVPEDGVEVTAIETKIISPNEGDDVDIKETLNLEASYKDVDSVNWVVRKGKCSSSGGDRVVAGNLYGYEDNDDWSGNEWNEALFTSSLDISEWDTGEYCFAFDPDEGARKTVSFNVIDTQPGIISPEKGQEIPLTQELILKARDFEATSKGVNWAVKYLGNPLAGNGNNDDYTWEDGNFTSSLDISDWDTGKYSFVFNPKDGDRYTRNFEIIEAEEVTLTIWTWDPEWGSTDPAGSDTRRDNVDYTYTKGETISLLATPDEGHDFRVWHVWENYGEENQEKIVSYHRDPALELLMDTDLRARAQFWENKIELESALYEGRCGLFGSDIGDTLTFTFSRDIKSTEDEMSVNFENGDELQFPSEDESSYEIDKNVLTITVDSETFSNPKDVIGKNIASFVGITDVTGNDITFPEDGVMVEMGEVIDLGEIDSENSGAQFIDNQNNTGTMTLNVLDKCGNGIESLGLDDMEIDFQYLENRDDFYNLGEGGYWNTELISEDSGEYEIKFERTGSVPYTRNWGIVIMDKIIEEELGIRVTYVEDPEIHSTYSFDYDFSNPFTAGQDVDIPVTFQTDEVNDIGYNGVRFGFEASSATSTGDVTFSATDTTNTEHTFTNQGFWGPASGFDIPANYTATTTWTLNFSEEGQYDISFSLIDTDDDSIVAGIENSITVTVVEPAAETGDNNGGGNTNNGDDVATLLFSRGGGGSAGGGNVCTRVEYGEWSDCQNGFQYREVVSKNSDFCTLSTAQQLDRTRECSAIVPEVLGETDYADKTLLRGSDDKIFVVFGDSIYHIKNLKELSNFHGPILTVGDEVIASFVKISKKDIPAKYKDVLGDKEYAEGTLLKFKNSVKIYVIKDGKMVHIKTLKELNNYKGPILVIESDE